MISVFQNNLKCSQSAADTVYQKEKESLKAPDFDTFKYDFKVVFSE